MRLLLFTCLTITLSTIIYLEEVLDCVQDDCEDARTKCGIDSDCRLSYNNFTTCIAQETEITYIVCKTNGHMAWTYVMDCYTECHYFELSSQWLVPIILSVILILH